MPFYWILIQKIGKMNKNCNSEGRLESIRYREGGIKIQEIVAILKIPQIGEYVPLVVEGAGKWHQPKKCRQKGYKPIICRLNLVLRHFILFLSLKVLKIWQPKQ